MSTPEPQLTVKDFLFDLGKIVEGALASDPEKVRAYTERLRDRLAAGGEGVAAKRLDRALNKRVARTVSLARAGQGALPVDSESRLPLGDLEMNVTPEALPVLSSHARASVAKFVRYAKSANELIRRGVPISASLLLYGPPGCGKTMLARQVAHDLELPLITARTDSLISSYLGSTAKNLRSLFDFAMSRPCVLFLDEFDALAKMRDDARELGELKRVVISLLQNIDAMGPDHVLIAATNHDHLLDSAIWRRFAHKIHLELPGQEDREHMLSQFLGESVADSDSALLARLTEGISGAELRELSNEAIREAVIAKREEISLADFLSAVGTYRPEQGKWHDMTPVQRIGELARRFGNEISQAQIGRLAGVTQPYVSKVLKKGNEHGI